MLCAGVALVLPLSGSAGSAAAATTPMPQIYSAAASPLARPLPGATPVAADSATLVAALSRQTKSYWGSAARPALNLNTHAYSPTMYVSRTSDPVAKITTRNCQNKPPGWDATLLRDHLAGTRIPLYAKPDPSSDGPMVIYNADTDELTETWATHKNADGTWSVCWGGRLRNASTSSGQFAQSFGVSASGLSQAAYTIRPQELAAGRINHVIGLALPEVKKGAVSFPANRTDGRYTGQALAMGQMLRLPASLDLKKLHLSPAAYTIAKAAQDYGIVVIDSSGAVTFYGQNVVSLGGQDPYRAVFRGRDPVDEFNGDRNRGEGAFPLDQLQVLPMNYQGQALPAGSSPQAAGSAPGSAVASTVIRQVAGTSPVTDLTGTVWARRAAYDNYATTRALAGKDILGTTNDRIYATQGWGMKSWAAPVTDGTYKVTMHLVEDYWSQPGRRVFDVTAEGKTVLQSVDVLARAGSKGRATEATFTVTVTDGQLNLGWVPIKDNATISALAIDPVR